MRGPDRRSGRRWQRTIWVALAAYLLSSLIVLIGFWIAHNIQQELTFPESLMRMDVKHYLSIVANGYEYDPTKRSTVAFFPVFPVAGGLVHKLTGVSPLAALLIVSHGFLACAFALFAVYLRTPSAETNAARSKSADYALLFFALVPTTMFFRLPYSESVFLVLSLLAMLCIAQGRSIFVVTILVGLTTATRPVGVALLAPWGLYLFHESASLRQALTRIATLLPLALFGLLAYMLFLYIRFDNPLAFAQTQIHWQMRPDAGLKDKVEVLLSWEPIWSVYVRSSPAHWERWNVSNPLLSLTFANPIYFVGTVALLALGAFRRWLSSYEVALGFALLFIPYVTRAYEWGMWSHGRFAAVAWPAYIVLGQLSARCPKPISVLLLTLCAVLLTVYAAEFALGIGGVF